MRIRKITSKEAWRLMGFSDEEYERAYRVCAETYLYHQAGNSMVVSVVYNVLKSLLYNNILYELHIVFCLNISIIDILYIFRKQ